MAQTIGEFLFELAKKGGIAETEKFMTDLAQDKEWYTKPLPEGFSEAVNNQLISIKDAKNNHTEIRKHYHAQVFDTLDKRIMAMADETKDEELKAALLAEERTYEKIPILLNGIRKDENKKASSNKGDKKEYLDQIDQLHAQLRAKDEIVAKTKTDSQNEITGFKKNYLLRSMMQGYKTTLDDLDPEVRSTTLFTLLNKELQDNKAQLTFDENDSLILLKQDGSNYYGDDNKLRDAKAFIEQTLSRNKLLKVTDQSNGQGDNANTGRQAQANPQGGSGGNGEQKKNHTLSGLAQQALKDINSNANIPVMG